MWRNQHEFLRALIATACLVACFAITILSWPERARSRLALTSPDRVVVVRAAVLTGGEFRPLQAGATVMKTAVEGPR